MAQSLRLILERLPDQAQIDDSDEFRKVCNCLEWYIPAVIQELHPESVSLDGILPAAVRKTGPGEVLLVGHGILFPEQRSEAFGAVPFHLQLQLDLERDEVSWLECRLGEKVDGQMKRIPYGKETLKRLIAAAEHPDSIDWFYKVTFGENRS